MQEKEVICAIDGSDLTASLFSEIDHHSARMIREKIDRELMIARPERLILDFSGVGFMDSSGIGLILGRAELARSLGAQLLLIGLSPRLYRLLALSGIDRIEGIKIPAEIKKEGSILR